MTDADTPDTQNPAAGPAAKPTVAKTIMDSVGAAGIAAAGAALAADGAIGLGGTRKGLHGLGKYFVWGSIFVLLSIFGFIMGILEAFGVQVSSTSTSNPGESIVGSVLLFIIGLFVIVVGTVKLAVRAGSVAGGLLLIREGWKRGEKIAVQAQQK